MTSQELMEKRAKVWETAKNFVDTHENENGVLSAEDSATYEKMEAEIEDLTNAIDRHRKAEQREKELSQPVNQPLTGKPYSGRQEEPKTGRASDEYRKAATDGSTVKIPICRAKFIPPSQHRLSSSKT